MSTYWNNRFIDRLAERAQNRIWYQEYALDGPDFTFRVVVTKEGDQVDVLIINFSRFTVT